MRQHIALITTDYPPQRTSAAVQMHDLAIEMKTLGHRPVVIVPTSSLSCKWIIEKKEGVILLRIKAPKTRDVSYARRTIMEFSLPFLMLHRLRKTPYYRMRWDIVTWYSPTIFFGPIIWHIRRMSKCRTYLILRDIFPEWALDLGVLRKSFIYYFFKMIANIQYAAADTIGVQTESNISYLMPWLNRPGKHVEVLYNWQTPKPNIGTNIDLSSTSLAGRKIAIYIGNMGIAQDMDILIDLAQNIAHRDDVGFLFVGRGSEVTRIKEKVRTTGLTNTLFFDEVDSCEMPGLLAQCYLGLLTLDLRHKTHNIPGKFLTYLCYGLPVLARVNQNTDLMNLINNERVGHAFDSKSAKPLTTFLIEKMLNKSEYDAMNKRCQTLFTKMYSVKQAANQILEAPNRT